MTRRTSLQLIAAAAAAFPQSKKAVGLTSWPQWGGPNRNFQVDAPPLKSHWPATGPRVIWKRPLGEGYSSPSIEGGVLYTMHGKPGIEFTLAVDTATGKTIWEQHGPMTFRSDAPDMGNGPYSTPLLVGDRLFTTGVAGRLECRARKDGNLIWKQELLAAHGGSRLMYGYASSPIAFRDLIVVPVGGKGKALMAFRQSDGSLAWSANDFKNAYSSPILINVGGLEQLVTVMDGFVFSVNPHNGDLQWQVPFRADYGISVPTPVWAPGNILFVSSEYNAGAKAIRLERLNQQTKATVLWESIRLRLHHGNAMCIDGTVYFSSGGKGSEPILSAVDVETGKIHWQERSISKATFVWADRKLITLDQDGNLMIADPSPKGFRILAKAELLTNLSWTPPVLVGSRLYIRDRRNLMAVELA